MTLKDNGKILKTINLKNIINLDWESVSLAEQNCLLMSFKTRNSAQNQISFHLQILCPVCKSLELKLSSPSFPSIWLLPSQNLDWEP